MNDSVNVNDMVYKQHIATPSSVVVIFNTGMKSVPKENPIYAKIMSALDNHNLDEIAGLIDLSTRIKKYTKGTFYVLDGVVYVEGEPLPETLSKRLMAFADEDLDYTPLVKFWNNLKENPSERSRQHLFAFLDQNGIPLTEDGCFVAYKRVTENYLDCHTNTFDNSIGAVVRMKREDVDDNPDQTCSRGLHVAAYPYAKDFYSNGHLVEVKVNPKDVVAVPADYNGQKMRVCEYTVLRECEGMRTEQLYKEDNFVDYDETADEDVWDDMDDNDDDGYTDDEWEDDLRNDLDNLDEDWVDEDEADLDNDDADEDADDVLEGDEVQVEVDSRGRLGVPAKFVRAIGLTEGQVAYVVPSASEGRVVIGDIQEEGSRAYVVDKDGSIRLSSYVLGLAGLDDFDKLYVLFEGGSNTLTVWE